MCEKGQLVDFGVLWNDVAYSPCQGKKIKYHNISFFAMAIQPFYGVLL
jgi:hypothetical protein